MERKKVREMKSERRNVDGEKNKGGESVMEER